MRTVSTVLIASLMSLVPMGAALADHHQHDDGVVHESATDRPGRDSDSVRQEIQDDQKQQSAPESAVGTGSGTADRLGRDSETHSDESSARVHTDEQEQTPGRSDERR